ncbi:MAG: DEAD/DEAH box helicase [Candidatus Paceibacterota bacterium]|jgi:superfamily II DNA/RNA helicase
MNTKKHPLLRGNKAPSQSRGSNTRGFGGFSDRNSNSRTNSRFGNSPRSFTKKRGGGKKEYIDEHMFINKSTQTEVNEYVSKNTFADFSVHPSLASNIALKGYKNPSPIQDQAIPVALTGKDVIGVASTGTGKTAAFLIPLIHKLATDKKHSIMILTPTRELAQQIEAEFQALTKGMKLYSVACVGGAPIGRQIRELDMGVHAIIGTPGRVKDLIARGKINMKQFGSIVLDEADRMLDMGFVDDMRYILGLMPKENRQSLFFSATLSPAIRVLCQDFLNDPTNISIKTRDTATSVDQDVIRIKHQSEKIDRLHDILNQPECVKVLIFREMKRHVDELAKELRSRGFKAMPLHGDMRNRERERAVQALTEGSAKIVIATDVAARGIDIADITHVINYDIPSTYDTYIHRVGRTGRGTKKGIALTFV